MQTRLSKARLLSTRKYVALAAIPRTSSKYEHATRYDLTRECTFVIFAATRACAADAGSLRMLLTQCHVLVTIQWIHFFLLCWYCLSLLRRVKPKKKELEVTKAERKEASMGSLFLVWIHRTTEGKNKHGSPEPLRKTLPASKTLWKTGSVLGRAGKQLLCKTDTKFLYKEEKLETL